MGSRFIVTPNEFQGSDSERINQAIRAAADSGRRAVIPRRNEAKDGPRNTWLLDSAILVESGTVLELDNCHLKLSDRCRDNMIRSANCGLGIREIAPVRDIRIRGLGNVVLEGADHPRATGDSGKRLGERTYGTDAGVAGESQTGDWRNIGILMACVENFSIQGLHMRDTHCWAISLERCSHGTLRDLDFASTEHTLIDGEQATILNQDGIDLRMGCHDILIENVTGHSGDDLVALTAIPGQSEAGSTGSTMVSSTRDRGDGLDDIRHVIIRNVRGYCQGGHHIVRLLNTSGVRMHDILIDGLMDTSPPGLRCKAALKIGDSGYGGGVAPLGDTYRVMVTRVLSRAQYAVLIGGSLCDSVITDVLHQGAADSAVFVAPGPEFLRDVTIQNVRVVPH
ncbi:MAG: hypothetical protein HPY44_09685 [Armatimonadetes bacterium]|nr:hypothetical protein [Armatimonadota bacterium]